jgi:hypothetical protein
MIAGIVVGTTLLIGFDVLISLETGQPSGAPPMSPVLRLYYVPVFVVFIGVMALIANALMGVGRRMRLRRASDWLLLGGSYSLVMAALPLMRLGLPAVMATLCSTVLPALSAYLLVRRAGQPAR